MDIIMPVMGGYESTELIRKAELDYQLSDAEKHFICGFSAAVNPDIVKKCMECGMDKILSKPMSADTLVKMVEEHKR